MNRIMVIGISAGVGKSTFARKLGESLEIPVYHLDVLHWEPGWTEAPKELFAARQREIVKKEQWIVEGNYSSTFSIRAEKCDTVIYLELPLHVCFYRVIKRWLTNIGETRPDMGEGCREKLDWEFVKFILTTYRSRKLKMAERLSNFTAEGKKVITLKSKRQINEYIQSLQSESRGVG
ncbi:topology modulation protein [Virgibacillus kekensis]|uniref:Topology modulation protein n=1 Tax=Virgibacillus kekensis TaxID=202261 RepID=A0ABV9DM19_9BACI